MSIDSDFSNFYCGDLLEGWPFNVDLYGKVMFVRLFYGGDLTLKIVYRRMGNNMITISESLKDVGESIVPNTKYGFSL